MTHLVLISPLPPLQSSLSEYGQVLVHGLLGLNASYQVTVLADISPSDVPIQEQELEGLQVIRCWSPGDFNTPLKILSHLKQLQPDAVLFNLQLGSFGHRFPSALPGLLTPWWIQQQGWPVIVLLHHLVEAMPHLEKISRLPHWLLKWGTAPLMRSLLQADQVIVTLSAYQQLLQQKYGARNVQVIGLGNSLPLASATQPGKHLLTFGKFGTYKRLERLIKVMERLQPAFPKLELWIGGCDHPQAPGYLATLQKRWAHLKNIRWLGWIEDSALAATLRSSLAVILDYDATTGSSGPLHLAASQGCTILAPALPDFLRSREEGIDFISYPAHHPDALTECLTHILTNPAQLAPIAANNLKWAQTHSLNTTAMAYHRVIQSVMETRNKHSTSHLEPILPKEKHAAYHL